MGSGSGECSEEWVTAGTDALESSELDAGAEPDAAVPAAEGLAFLAKYEDILFFFGIELSGGRRRKMRLFFFSLSLFFLCEKIFSLCFFAAASWEAISLFSLANVGGRIAAFGGGN